MNRQDVLGNSNIRNTCKDSSAIDEGEIKSEEEFKGVMKR